MITGARNYVSVPAAEVLLGGVLGVARIIDATDPHDLLGAEYDSMACSPGNSWAEFCTTWPCDDPFKKEFNAEFNTVEGDPFVGYTGVECELASMDVNEQRAKDAYTYAERRIVDDHFCDYLSASPVIGTATGIAEAVGLAEAYAHSLYGGVPTIYIPVELVPAACQQGMVAPSLNGSLVTCQGSRVANIICTPFVSAVAVTGQVTLIRGPLKTYSAPPQMMCDGGTEKPRALAERIYVPLVECLAGKVTVTP